MGRNSDRSASVATRQRPDGSIDALLQFKPQSRDRCSGSRLHAGGRGSEFDVLSMLSISPGI